MSEEFSIGIDLGTTYSCLAYIDDNNEPVVERNYEHEDTTPSVILFNDVGEKLVGSSAKDMFLMYSSDRFVLDIKRKMGTDYSVDIDGIRYTPPTLSGLILRKLLKDFEENHGLDEGSVKSAVITVPAYFGQEEREATVNAGRIAGLEEVTLLNEPTAAAICFGFGNNQGGPKKVLVYDLGGGTFDVTVLQIDGKSFTAIATDGQRLMGGKDWDAALKQIIIGKIAEMSGLSEDEIEADNDIMEALVLDSEHLGDVRPGDVYVHHAGLVSLHGERQREVRGHCALPDASFSAHDDDDVLDTLQRVLDLGLFLDALFGE